METDVLVPALREIKKFLPEANTDYLRGLLARGDLRAVRIGRSYFARRTAIAELRERFMAATAEPK